MCVCVYIYIYVYVYIWASLVAETVKNLPAMKESWVQSLGQEDPLEKEMATHSCGLPGEFHKQRSIVHGVTKSWTWLTLLHFKYIYESQTWLSNFTFTFHFHALEEMATHSSVLAWRIPGMGEAGGLPSMGSHRVGHYWRDLAAAACVYVCIYILFFFSVLGHHCSAQALRCCSQASPLVAPGLSSSEACGFLVPHQRSPSSPALGGRFSTTGLPGNPQLFDF